MAAAMATIKTFKEENVISKLHYLGKLLADTCNSIIRSAALQQFVSVVKCEWMPTFIFRDADAKPCPGLRTLFMQEMIKRGVLFQGIFVPSFAHTEDDIYYFSKAFAESLEIYKKALEDGYEQYLIGSPAKAVFRRLL
jgi:spore coat polysaccharide biosynthesis protein SpsF